LYCRDASLNTLDFVLNRCTSYYRGYLSDDEDATTEAMDTDSHIASKSTEAERASAGIEEYTLLFGNNGWYILFRLHQASGIENKLCLSVCLSVCLSLI
jgi:hypothetical protein